ncbi:hypothetical protein NE236_35185 [Actinoallomurus purpureus]|uniref:hypothetical protein n=1 Tax=Actinoallomurus purpureus TaxID=478114 RepID=UPI00209399D4|nr:hypothetical protein [Actinoallomurus purpureus]MCO6010221.1 hypothetical protein [Actinoallomurus purpureus]
MRSRVIGAVIGGVGAMLTVAQWPLDAAARAPSPGRAAGGTDLTDFAACASISAPTTRGTN